MLLSDSVESHCSAQQKQLLLLLLLLLQIFSIFVSLANLPAFTSYGTWSLKCELLEHLENSSAILQASCPFCCPTTVSPVTKGKLL